MSASPTSFLLATPEAGDAGPLAPGSARAAQRKARQRAQDGAAAPLAPNDFSLALAERLPSRATPAAQAKTQGEGAPGRTARLPEGEGTPALLAGSRTSGPGGTSGSGPHGAGGTHGEGGASATPGEDTGGQGRPAAHPPAHEPSAGAAQAHAATDGPHTPSDPTAAHDHRLLPAETAAPLEPAPAGWAAQTWPTGPLQGRPGAAAGEAAHLAPPPPQAQAGASGLAAARPGFMQALASARALHQAQGLLPASRAGAGLKDSLALSRTAEAAEALGARPGHSGFGRDGTTRVAELNPKPGAGTRPGESAESAESPESAQGAFASQVLQAAEGLGHPTPGGAGFTPTAQAPAAPGTTAPGAPPQGLPEALGTTAWQQALGQQVLRSVQAGLGRAELALHPADLGPLTIELDLSDERLSARFGTDHAAVREAVEAALPLLRGALASQGLELGDTAFGAAPFDAPASGAPGPDAQASGRHAPDEHASHPAAPQRTPAEASRAQAGHGPHTRAPALQPPPEGGRLHTWA